MRTSSTATRSPGEGARRRHEAHRRPCRGSHRRPTPLPLWTAVRSPRERRPRAGRGGKPLRTALPLIRSRNVAAIFNPSPLRHLFVQVAGDGALISFAMPMSTRSIRILDWRWSSASPPVRSTSIKTLGLPEAEQCRPGKVEPRSPCRAGAACRPGWAKLENWGPPGRSDVRKKTAIR